MRTHLFSRAGVAGGRPGRLAGVALVLALLGGVAGADDLYIRSGTAEKPAELGLKGVTIRKVEGGEIYYATSQGTERHRSLADISRIEIPGDTAFNDAEKKFSDAYGDPKNAKAKFGEAYTAYQRVPKSSRPWVADYVRARTQEAAKLSGRFDAEVDAWLELVSTDLAAAQKSRPLLDGVDPKSQYLAAAAKKIADRAKGATNKDQQKALLGMLKDIQSKMGDKAAALKTLDALMELGGTPEEIAVNNTAIAEELLQNKDLGGAAERLGKVGDPTVLPDANRATYMFVSAEVKGAKMSATSSADQWKDLALEYMRIVAAFPGNPNAGQALLKVAQIHETIKDNDTALKIYQQVVREHGNTPAGQEAARSAARLSKPAAAGNG